jgi:hypothetical protein
VGKPGVQKTLLIIGDAIRLCRFRTTNRYLPIETGRWRNIDTGTVIYVIVRN